MALFLIVFGLPALVAVLAIMFVLALSTSPTVTPAPRATRRRVEAVQQ